MNELKAGTVINGVAIITRMATTFFITPYVIAQLGIEEYGLFMLSHTVLFWLALTDFGLGATINKYVATYCAQREANEEARFLGQAMILFSLLGTLTFALGMAGYVCLEYLFPNLSPKQMETFRILYLLTVGNLVLAFPLKPIGTVPGAHLKFIVPGIVKLGHSLLNALLTVLLLLWGVKSIGLTVLVVTTAIGELLWGLFYTLRCLGVRIIFLKPDFRLFRELFTFSFWVLLSQLMDLLYWRAGTPILARLSGMEAVTVFTIGIMFSQYFTTASTAISSVLNPKIMHMVALNASKQQLTHAMVRVGRIQLFLLTVILCGFGLFGRPFVELWVGDTIGEQSKEVWLGALLVMLPLLLPLTQNMGIGLLQAMNIHKGRAIILFYSSLICALMGAALSYGWGALGMFVGTAISLFIGQGILINRYYQRKAGLDMVFFFKETYLPLLPPLLPLLAMGAVLAYLCNTNSWSSWLIVVAAFGLGSTAWLFCFYFHPEERMLFLGSALHKLRRKRI